MSVTSPEGPSSRASRTEAAEPSLAPGQGHGDSSEPIARLPSRYAGQSPKLTNEAIWLREQREGILLISDKGFASRAFAQELIDQRIELLRPSRKREKEGASDAQRASSAGLRWWCLGAVEAGQAREGQGPAPSGPAG